MKSSQSLNPTSKHISVKYHRFSHNIGNVLSIQNIDYDNQRENFLSKLSKVDFLWGLVNFTIQLLRLYMGGNVAIYLIFGFKCIYYGPKRIFLLLVNTNILVYFPLISFLSIKVYKVETTNMVIFHWKMVSVEYEIPVNTVVLSIWGSIMFRSPIMLNTATYITHQIIHWIRYNY